MYPLAKKVIPYEADAQKNDKQSRGFEIKEDGHRCQENTSHQEMLVNHRKDNHHRQEEKPEIQLCEDQGFFFIE
jgi:hypothetical protein